MRRETLLALGLVILLLAASAGKSLLISLPPARSSPGEFDANRAKARLAFVLGDQRPHPVDLPADDLVRARIVATLAQLGIKPIVRDQMVCNDFQKARLVACARVRNIIAVLGPPRGRALLLSAHYDSVPVGPGASDDGIGVATLLEVGSIVRDRPLKRPIILLFNEGEELGLLGARAFLADPLSRSVDSLLNFEARGVNGPVTMFETSQPNGSAIAAYAAAVRRPSASSLATDVARLIPNDTDVTTFKERGWLTLNSAIVGNETRYHSPGDNLAGLDVRSLQDMGDEALALTSELSAGIPQTHGTRIFSGLFEPHIFRYPFDARGQLPAIPADGVRSDRVDSAALWSAARPSRSVPSSPAARRAGSRSRRWASFAPAPTGGRTPKSRSWRFTRRSSSDRSPCSPPSVAN